MRLADYVMQFLENEKVKYIFMISGGGIMYLMDTLGQSRMLNIMDYEAPLFFGSPGLQANRYSNLITPI